MQAKVIASLPITDVQILRVGKKITDSHKILKASNIFVNVFIFDAKANVPIFPIKEKKCHGVNIKK